jgi:hypothetical protein
MHAGGRSGAEGWLLAAGKSLEQLPIAIQEAVKKGTVGDHATVCLGTVLLSRRVNLTTLGRQLNCC